MKRRIALIDIVEQKNQLIHRFKVGDLVVPYYATGDNFYGQVVEIDLVCNKVYVDLNGTIRQFDPDEIRIHLFQKALGLDTEKTATVQQPTRRGARLGNASKVAIYHVEPGRKYKLTKNEQENGAANCPFCRCEMESSPFSRGIYLYNCPECEFKITSDAIYDADYRRDAVEVTADSKIAWINMKMPREFYVPKNGKNTQEYKYDDVDVIAYSYEREGNDKVFGMAFAGKQSKPLWHYSFKSIDGFKAQLDKTIEERKSKMQRMKNRRDERSDYQHDFKVGDLLYSSWGYDQTNIDFYQVVEVREKTVTIREIASKIVSSEQTYDSVVPDANHFTGSPMVKRPSPGGYIKLKSYSSAYKWDGRPKQETNSMFGH